jgi:hypothetical protein
MSHACNVTAVYGSRIKVSNDLWPWYLFLGNMCWLSLFYEIAKQVTNSLRVIKPVELLNLIGKQKWWKIYRHSPNNFQFWFLSVDVMRSNKNKAMSGTRLRKFVLRGNYDSSRGICHMPVNPKVLSSVRNNQPCLFLISGKNNLLHG